LNRLIGTHEACRIGASIVLLTFCLTLQVNAEAPMPIEDALKRAFSHNREYLSALEELNNASARITEARAGAFPVLSFSGGYTRNWEPNEFVISMNGEAQHLRIGTDNTFSAGLRFTQPLYLGGKVGTALKIAKIYKNYSLQNLVTVYNKVRLDVYKSYYGLVLANEVVRVAEQAHILATASREVVEKMAFQGVVSEYDLLRAKVAESNTIPAEIRAHSVAATAGDALKSILGMSLSDEINILSDCDFSNVDPILSQPVDYYRNLALENRSDLKGLDYLVQIMDKNIKIQKSAYLPSLIFATDLAWQAQRDDWNVEPDNWNRSISSSLLLEVPIFEGFGRSAKVKQARIEKYQIHLSYEQLRDVVELEVKSTYGDLKESFERLGSQEQTVEMAKEGLRISELRYKNGVGTHLEVIDARTALVQAEINLVNARHDLIISLAAFDKAIGTVKP